MSTPEAQASAEEEKSAFAAGFDDDNAQAASPPQAEDPQPEAIEAAAAEPEPQPEPEPPQTISVTAEDWKRVQDEINELKTFRGGIRTEFDKLGGKYGEINRALQQRPGGVRVSKDALAKISAEYPDLGPLLAEAFSDDTQAQPHQAVPSVTPEEIQRRAQELLQPELKKVADLRVDLAMSVHHKDWRNVVTSAEFDAWRQTLPYNEALQTLQSEEADFVGGQITKFKAHRQELEDKAKQAAEAAANTAAQSAARAARQQNGQKRLGAAITPQGTARAGAPTKTEQDYFKEGFSS